MHQLYRSVAMGSSEHASHAGSPNYVAIILRQSAGDVSAEKLSPGVFTTHPRGRLRARAKQHHLPRPGRFAFRIPTFPRSRRVPNEYQTFAAGSPYVEKCPSGFLGPTA